jgi:hypothetical protein
MEASLMGSSSSKCDACIASFLLITLFYTQNSCEIRLFSIQCVPQSELLESPTPPKKRKSKNKRSCKSKTVDEVLALHSHGVQSGDEEDEEAEAQRTSSGRARDYASTTLPLPPSNSKTKNGPLVGRKNT